MALSWIYVGMVPNYRKRAMHYSSLRVGKYLSFFVRTVDATSFVGECFVDGLMHGEVQELKILIQHIQLI